MKNYLKHWNFMRALRLALGIFIMVQGVITKEWMFAFAGFLFSLMPILNVGCCGVSGCNTPIAKSNQKAEDIIYEEIK
jgi:hypothetical protein